MQGRILIVEAIATNRIVLKVKLTTAFYEVIQAASVAEALAIVRQEVPDLVIAALSLPDGGAAEVCKGLAAHPLSAHVPVLAIGCQPAAAARMATLEAGVHDVLPHPTDETLLLGRVRSLIRAHNAAAEWRMRDDTCRALGLAEPASSFDTRGSCVLVGKDRAALQGYATRLRPLLRHRTSLATVRDVMQRPAEDAVPDVFVLVLPADADAALEDLRLISTLRTAARTRHVGVVVLQTRPNAALGAHALDLGADDLMPQGFEPAELALRIKSVTRRKRMGDQLRASVRTGLQAAVFDPLTGLYNRRYAMPHLARIVAHSRATGRSFAVLAADLDLFKSINDHYGHASGDAVLVEVANRLRNLLRSTDMVARIGGEEFMILLSGVSPAEASETGQRICQTIAHTPFVVPGSQRAIDVTISIGMASSGDAALDDMEPDAAGQFLLAQADKRLMAAKRQGRNQLNRGRPAA